MAQLTMSEIQQTLRSATTQYPPDWSDADQSAFAESVARQWTAELRGSTHSERRIDDAIFSRGAYAISDDALNLFPSIVQAVIAVFAKGPAGALADLVALLLRYRSLRVELTPEEAAVLRVLQDAKKEKLTTLVPADIQDRLRQKQLKLSQPLGDVLDSLLAKKADKTTLVREANGRWAIGNV
jgi:hypothetical protein